MLSINLTVHGWSVLVVGGGAVGRRRAELLADAGADVTVINPEAADSHVAGGIRRRAEPFAPHHLAGVRLAFACAPPEVNRVVVAAAKAVGVLVNSASDPEASDFALPSVVNQGGLRLTVSTGGASPALAKRIAADLAANYDGSYAEWVRVLGVVRAAVRERVADAGERARLLAEFADPVWLEELRDYGADAILADMLAAAGGEGERPA